MNPQQLAAMLGFVFIVARVALGSSDALACQIGAAVFPSTTAVYRTSSISQGSSSDPDRCASRASRCERIHYSAR